MKVAKAVPELLDLKSGVHGKAAACKVKCAGLGYYVGTANEIHLVRCCPLHGRLQQVVPVT